MPIRRMTHLPFLPTSPEHSAVRAEAAPEEIIVQGLVHRRVGVPALKPGDICMEYMGGPPQQKSGPLSHPTFMGQVIRGLNRLTLPRPPRAPGASIPEESVNVGHTSLIASIDSIEPDAPKANVLDVRLSGLRQRALATFDAQTVLVYRAKNPRFAERVVEVAKPWTTRKIAMQMNILLALECQNWGPRGRAFLASLLGAEGRSEVQVASQERAPRLTCCAMVAAAGAIAAAKMVGETEGLTFEQALEQIEAESSRKERRPFFWGNPESVSPALLHRRLLEDPDVEVVGWIQVPRLEHSPNVEPVRAPTSARPEASVGDLMIQRRPHPTVRASSLRRGDLLLEYLGGDPRLERRPPSALGRRVILGNRLAAPRWPRSTGDDSVRGSVKAGHASIFLGHEAKEGTEEPTLLVADNILKYHFQRRELVGWDTDNIMVYRFKDAETAEAVASVAERWASDKTRLEFELPPDTVFLRSPRLSRRGKEHLTKLLDADDRALAGHEVELPRMYCSEAVTAVCATAALRRLRAGSGVDAREAVERLARARVEDPFWPAALDPRATLPVRLHQRLLAHDAVETVGRLRVQRREKAPTQF